MVFGRMAESEHQIGSGCGCAMHDKRVLEHRTWDMGLHCILASLVVLVSSMLM